MSHFLIRTSKVIKTNDFHLVRESVDDMGPNKTLGSRRCEWIHGTPLTLP